MNDGLDGVTYMEMVFAKPAPPRPRPYPSLRRQRRHAVDAPASAGLAHVARDAALRAVREPTEGLLSRDAQREVLDRGFDEVVWPLLVALGALPQAA